MSDHETTQEQRKSILGPELKILRRPSIRAPKADAFVLRAIEILRMPSAKRTPTQIEGLKSALHIKFFTNLEQEHGDDIVDKSIQKLRHEFHSNGETIFNLGEKGRAFYIILKGSVGIFVKLPKKIIPQAEENSHNTISQLQPQPQPQPQTQSQSQSQVQPHPHPHPHPQLQLQQQQQLQLQLQLQPQSDTPQKPSKQQLQQHQPQDQPEFELVEVNVLRAGSYFGELALLNDSVRTATIVCKEDSDFAVLDVTDFKGILGAKGQWKVQKDIEFLVNVPFFTLLQRRQISTLIYHFELLNFRRNNIIYREGEEAKFIYIIRKGEIKLMKQVGFRIEEDTFHPVADNMKNKLNFTKSVEVTILGPSETFGEEDIYLEAKRQVTAVCVSDEAEVFAIKAEDFNQRILCLRDFPSFFEENCQNKIYSRNRRIEQIAAVKDKNKEMLYGKNGLALLPPSTKNSSPNKAKSVEKSRVTASPSQRARKMSNIKGPIQNGAPIRVLERMTSRLDETKRKATILLTEGDLMPSALFSRQLTTKFKDELRLSPAKYELTDLSRESPSRVLKTEASSLSRPRHSVRSVRSKSKNQNFSLIDESFATSKLNASPAKTLKLENSAEASFLKSDLLNEVDQSFSRKYLSTKLPQKGLRERQMVEKYLDSKEKVLKGLRENNLQLLDDSGVINFEHALFKSPARFVREERFRTPPPLPTREITLSERLQTVNARSRSTKKEAEPKLTVNIHMDKLRLKRNMDVFFKTQAKIINHIASESPDLSFLPTRSNTYPNPYNPLATEHPQRMDSFLKFITSENDLSANRDDSYQSTDRPIMIRALVHSRQLL